MQVYTEVISMHRLHKGKTKTKGGRSTRRRPEGGGVHLASLRVFGSVQAHIIDVSVCEVISGSGQPYVDLAG